MKATGRDRLITIERKTVTQNDLGEEVETWTAMAQAWAEKRDVSDAERLNAAEVGATISTRFRLLWSDAYDDVTPLDRINYDGKRWDIMAVKEIGTREGIEITAFARAE